MYMYYVCMYIYLPTRKPVHFPVRSFPGKLSHPKYRITITKTMIIIRIIIIVHRDRY